MDGYESMVMEFDKTNIPLQSCLAYRIGIFSAFAPYSHYKIIRL